MVPGERLRALPRHRNHETPLFNPTANTMYSIERAESVKADEAAIRLFPSSVWNYFTLSNYFPITGTAGLQYRTREPGNALAKREVEVPVSGLAPPTSDQTFRKRRRRHRGFWFDERPLATPATRQRRPRAPSPKTAKMTKGTSSFGKRHNKTHVLCRRCGSRSLHVQKKTCANCGYPSASVRRCQEKKDHGLWPHADAEGCPPQVQERLPGRHTEGREGSGEPGINDGCEMEVGWSKI
ncbi:hypothetical protein KC333_g123 [Hortaea werneckii]|nr:hypothetical protein KC333_g123 [Hortaea werneckii]